MKTDFKKYFKNIIKIFDIYYILFKKIQTNANFNY